MEAIKEVTDFSQYLTFFIGEELFAVDILQVREILRYEVVTRIPSTPSFIRGVINLRGNVVPVVDLAVKFGDPPTLPTSHCCIIIVECTLEEKVVVMGIMVDEVSQVIDLTADDIKEPPPFGTRVRVDFLVGMGTLDQKFALILNIEKVLSTSELLLATNLENVSQTIEAGSDSEQRVIGPETITE